MKAAFFRKRPHLAEIYHSYGNFTLDEYFQILARAIQPSGTVKKSLHTSIITETKRLLGDKIDMTAFETQISNFPVVSTADHHGILSSKILYNSNIVYSQLTDSLNLKYIPVLSSGGIPFNNESHPGGFFFNGNKIRFIKSKYEDVPVSHYKAGIQSGNSIVDLIVNLNGLNIINPLNDEETKFLEYLCFDTLDINSICSEHSVFSDQVTIVNYKLWKLFFAQGFHNRISELVYLQMDRIIKTILIEEIQNPESLVSKILFDKNTLDVFIRNFQDIPGCWGERNGSFLFWEVRSDNKGLGRLEHKPGSGLLCGRGKKFTLDRDCIISALNNGLIQPTLFFNFLLLSFEGGLFTLGGFNQVDYLGEMQAAFIRSLSEIGLPGAADDFAKRVTNGFICGMNPFHFESSIDMLWEFNSVNGVFNGNLDRGITPEGLASVGKRRLKELIDDALPVLLAIVK